MNREDWLHYMLGYMTGKGWRLPRKYVDDFKVAFPEVDDEILEVCIEKEDKKLWT